MIFKDVFKGIKKEFFYNNYQRLFDDGVDYDKTTRPKMTKAIVDFYSDPKNIVKLCSKAEVDYLNEILAIDRNDIALIEKNLKNPKDWLIRNKLADKMLIDILGFDIPDEFVESIKQAKVLYEEKKYLDYDENLNIVLGAMRVYARIIKQNFVIFFKLILEFDDKQLDELMDSPRFTYYVETYYNQNDVEELFFRDFDDYYEEIVDRQERYGVITPTLLEPNAYIDIFDYGFDLSKKYNKDYISQGKENFAFDFFTREMIIAMILNVEPDSFLEFINNFGLEKKSKKDIALIKKVMDNYPSATLLGSSSKEFEKFLGQLEKRNKEYALSFDKQINACIGEKQADEFYATFFGLLAYLNKKYEIKPEIQEYIESGTGINPSEMIEVNDFFFANPIKYVDEYLEHVGDLVSMKHKQILEDFKKTKSGIFILYSYSEEYAQMIGEDAIYQVKGIRCNIDEIIPKEKLPVPLKTNLLMYNGNIIYDGVFSKMSIKFKGNALMNLDSAVSSLKEKYSLELFGDSSIKEEDEEINFYIVRKGRTDLESSLKRLNKTLLELKMEERYCEDVEELKEDILFDFKMVFEATCKNQSVQEFFKDLIRNENTSNLIFPKSDVEACYVFLYENKGKLCYYIPDEIKRIIKNKLNIYS